MAKQGMDRLLTRMEVAARLGVTYNRVAQLVRDGRLEEWVGENGQRRIRESAVRRYEEWRDGPRAPVVVPLETV